MIYLYIPEAQRIDLLAIYGKNEKDTLSIQDKRVLKSLADRARREVVNRSKGGLKS